MNHALSTPQTAALSAHSAEAFMGTEALRMLSDTIMKGATPEEISFFGEVCKRTGLDPFRKQIHAVARWDKDLKRNVWTFQMGIDGFRAIASRNKSCAGIDDAVFEPKDESTDYPIKASVTAWKFVSGQRIPFTATARWSEFVQYTRDGKVTSMWHKMPYSQLAKCAEALALRKAFPEDLSGLHTEDEMQQADNPPRDQPSPYKLTELEDQAPPTPTRSPEPAIIDAEVTPADAEYTGLAVPDAIAPFIGGRWKSHRLSDGSALGDMKVKPMLRMREQLPEGSRWPLLATYIDQVHSILVDLEIPEDQFADTAAARADLDVAFPQDLWANPAKYPEILAFAKSLIPSS